MRGWLVLLSVFFVGVVAVVDGDGGGGGGENSGATPSRHTVTTNI